MEDKWETETGRFFKFSTSKDSKEGRKMFQKMKQKKLWRREVCPQKEKKIKY